MVLAGKIALVTGGAQRIGRELALALAQRGAHVAISYLHSARDAKRTVADIQACGVHSIAVKADVTRPRDVATLAKVINKSLGTVDILVNNASVFTRTPWPRISEEAWDIHLDTNLKGPFLCTQMFGPKMFRRGFGKIINLADTAAEQPWVGYIPYSVSKAGLVCLTKVTAKAMAPHVQVNAIAPGVVLFPEKTTRKHRAKALKNVALRRSGSPQDVANVLLFLIEGGDYVTGSVYSVDGGRLLM